jgi:hypothetical protein
MQQGVLEVNRKDQQVRLAHQARSPRMWLNDGPDEHVREIHEASYLFFRFDGARKMITVRIGRELILGKKQKRRASCEALGG